MLHSSYIRKELVILTTTEEAVGKRSAYISSVERSRAYDGTRYAREATTCRHPHAQALDILPSKIICLHECRMQVLNYALLPHVHYLVVNRFGSNAEFIDCDTNVFRDNFGRLRYDENRFFSRSPPPTNILLLL